MTGEDPPRPDPVIEVYKKDVDRTLLRENLKRTPEERVRRLDALMNAIRELNRAGREQRRERKALREEREGSGE